MTTLQSRSIRVLTIFALSVTLVVPLASPASATNSYYGGSGYDASYPQCAATSSPPGFAIIGLGHGRPFTANTCASSEVSLAPGPNISFYFNTGYALAYAKSDYGDCKTASLTQYPSVSGHLQSQMQAAWAIGCSESEYAMKVAPAGVTPVAWWADIETGNSWSSNTVLNTATIDGMVWELHPSGASIPVGVYSTPSMWHQITGTGYVNSGINADWQAGVTSCPSTPSTGGFTLTSTTTGSTYAPLWIIQNGTTPVNGVNFDLDTAC